MRRSRPKQLEKDGLVQWPMVMGAIVPVVNLEGVKPGDLVLSGSTLGQHLSRQDHQVGRRGDRQAQPEAEAAEEAITVVRRADGSGTTFNFTDYLSQGQPGLEDQGRLRHRGASGRSASAPRATKALPATSAQTKNSIGYVEYAYAKQNKLTYTALINKAGKRRWRSRPHGRPF
jgi:phosphate transport system substrate-binding protein